VFTLLAIWLVGYVTMSDSSTAVAVRQWFLGIIRPIYQPIMNWLSRFARRSLVRQATTRLTSILLGLIIGALIRYFAWLYNDRRKGERAVKKPLYAIETARYRTKQAVKRLVSKVWNTRFPFPRWGQVIVALVFAVLTVMLCLKAGDYFEDTIRGWTKSVIFSMVAFWVFEKVPLFGFDALASVWLEHWRWLKERPRVAKVVKFVSTEEITRTVARKVSRTPEKH
jgi:hypothetical protein